MFIVAVASQANATTTSSHFMHQLVMVDTAGWVRHHLLNPIAHNDPGALSESELLQRMGGSPKIPFERAPTTPTKVNSAAEPEAISPAKIELEALRLSAARLVSHSLNFASLGVCFCIKCSSLSANDNDSSGQCSPRRARYRKRPPA